MTTTITDGTTVLTPEIITGWEASQESGNVIHAIIGKADPDVTLKPAGTRAGTLELLFLNVTDAETARAMLTQPLPFIIESTDAWLNNIHIVANGSISSVLEDTTRSMWTISFDYQEITP